MRRSLTTDGRVSVVVVLVARGEGLEYRPRVPASTEAGVDDDPADRPKVLKNLT